jgi:ring-1,2-phenylacetyl-CoA epoxidase subunit PaaE
MSTEFYSLNISAVERLTKDAVALTFDVPKELEGEFAYKQGQHLTLKATIDGQDVRRSYSICTGINENKLQVGVKRIEGGLFSNYANTQLKKGMSLEVMPPQGHFYTEVKKDAKKNYLFIAVGSGITPNLSHIKTLLDAEPDSHVTLVYGNRSTPLMMFRETLAFIKNQYMSRFHWVNIFSREENEAAVFNGRISSNKLADLAAVKVLDPKGYDDLFICGPEDMINDIAAAAKSWGYSDAQVHYELFYAASADDKAKENQERRAEMYGNKLARVGVKVAGRKTLLDLEMGGANILDAAMDAGADLPFSCKGGVCATCKAKVVKGQVEMDMNHSLTPEEVAEGMVLTCQAHPITDDVEIDFDFS